MNKIFSCLVCLLFVAKLIGQDHHQMQDHRNVHKAHPKNIMNNVKIASIQSINSYIKKCYIDGAEYYFYVSDNLTAGIEYPQLIKYKFTIPMDWKFIDLGSIVAKEIMFVTDKYLADTDKNLKLNNVILSAVNDGRSCAQRVAAYSESNTRLFDIQFNRNHYIPIEAIYDSLNVCENNHLTLGENEIYGCFIMIPNRKWNDFKTKFKHSTKFGIDLCPTNINIKGIILYSYDGIHLSK